MFFWLGVLYIDRIKDNQKNCSWNLNVKKACIAWVLKSSVVAQPAFYIQILHSSVHQSKSDVAFDDTFLLLSALMLTSYYTCSSATIFFIFPNLCILLKCSGREELSHYIATDEFLLMIFISKSVKGKPRNSTVWKRE